MKYLINSFNGSAHTALENFINSNSDCKSLEIELNSDDCQYVVIANLMVKFLHEQSIPYRVICKDKVGLTGISLCLGNHNKNNFANIDTHFILTNSSKFNDEGLDYLKAILLKYYDFNSGAGFEIYKMVRLLFACRVKNFDYRVAKMLKIIS